MKINYNITGSKRKALVKSISQELNITANYLRVPTFAYEIGEYILDKDGVLVGPNDSELISKLQNLHNFTPVSELYDVPPTETQEKVEPLGDTSISNTLTLEIPKDNFSETVRENLQKLIDSKAMLIKKAVGADSLEIEETEDTLLFPWFRFDSSLEEVIAYYKFISAIYSMAERQKRITAKAGAVDNEKYAFRCFLLRLGFIGKDYKDDRKILLANLSGNGSYAKIIKRTEQKPENPNR